MRKYRRGPNWWGIYYLTDEELDELTRFRWEMVLLGGVAGLALSVIFIVLVLRLM